MKKSFPLALLLMCLIHAQAQQTWRFYLAFEDGSGSKDTIWMVYDTAAHYTLPVDTPLGEGSLELTPGKFSTFCYNFDKDTTKTKALPYSIYPKHGVHLYAVNYSYPIKINWDTALLHAPYLPYEQGEFKSARFDNLYFFTVNNYPIGQCYNFLIDNNVYIPEPCNGWIEVFPIEVSLSGRDEVGIDNLAIDSERINCYPNPCHNQITVKSNYELIKSVRIYNTKGDLVEYSMIKGNIININTQSWSKGLYFLKIETDKKTYHEKIFKIY